MAGVKAPLDDLDVVELHDAYSSSELQTYEDLGLCKYGEGGRFIDEGHSTLAGKLPVNPSGGLLACGHPVGATGVAQICDVVQQIRGEAGERQLARHSLGLAQNLGGSGATCVVSILGEL